MTSRKLGAHTVRIYTPSPLVAASTTNMLWMLAAAAVAAKHDPAPPVKNSSQMLLSRRKQHPDPKLEAALNRISDDEAWCSARPGACNETVAKRAHQGADKRPRQRQEPQHPPASVLRELWEDEKLRQSRARESTSKRLALAAFGLIALVGVSVVSAKSCARAVLGGE